MIKYILRRIAMMIPVLLGVTFIIFTMMYFTPGSAEDYILGDYATEEDKEIFREENGLNDSFSVQFVRYVSNILKGDLGTSYTTKLPVADEIFSRFGNTLFLSAIAIFFASILGIILGVISAVRQYSLLDSLTRIFAMLGVSMPSFWEGLMLIILFSVVFGFLPSSGILSWNSWILPAVTIGTQSLAAIMRMVRSSMLEAIRQDYVITARAKGQTEFWIIARHVFRNAVLPIITVIGNSFTKLLGGVAVVEIVFAIPGVGKLIVEGIKMKNAPLVQGGILYIAFFMSIANLLVDIIYAYVDPRIRSKYVSSKKKQKKTNMKSGCGRKDVYRNEG